MEKNWFEIKNVEKGVVKQYTGKANFAFKAKACSMCGSPTVRHPLNTHYVNLMDGKLLTTVRSGMLYVEQAEPDYIYGCTKCAYAETNLEK